jgi:drug/metabolite transporter (DMT)-like permease
VTGVIGGLLAALMWGTSTVVASRSTRMIGSQQVLAYVMLTGLAAMAVVAPISEGVPGTGGRGAAWALLAGITSVGGLSLAYAALRVGKVGVVAPISSTEGALAALFSVVFLGETLSPGVGEALGVVTAGVVAVTYHARPADVHLRPALLALAAAAVFGVGLIASSRAGNAVGPMWTILIARAVGVVGVAVPLALSGRLARPGRALPLVVFSGVAEVAGFAAYIVGARHGVAVPAVLSSQFAAVATLLSFVVFGERLTRLQVAGACAIGVGVAAVALLQAG